MPVSEKWSTVPSQEKHNARTERYDSRGRLIVETILLCDWEARWSLITDLMSTFRAYPDSPNQSQPIGATQARVMTLAEKYTTDAAQEKIIYEKAWIRVSYGQFFDIEEELSYETEAMQLDHQTFRWKTSLGSKDSQQLKHEEAPFYTWHDEVLVRKFQGVSPRFLDSLLREAIGLTNKSTYTSKPLERDFAPGTLRLLDPIVKPAVYLNRLNDPQNDPDVQNVVPFGGNGFNVDLHFKFRPEGHNKFWRPDMDRYISPGNDVKGGFDKMQIRDPSTSESAWKDYDPFPKSERIDKLLKDFPSNRPIAVVI